MAANEAPKVFDIDVSPANLEAGTCPWAVHAALRERGPVVAHPRPGGDLAYAVTRYDDVVAGLQDPRFAKDSSYLAKLFPPAQGTARQAGFVLTGAGSRHLLNTDPPDHSRLRRLVSHAFTPRRIEELRPRIQQLADQLLDELERSDEPDLIEGFAFELSITMICELLGVPAEHRADFRRWSVAATTPPTDGPPDGVDGVRQLHEFLAAHVSAKREELSGVDDLRRAPDVLSAMIVARDAQDSLTDSELVGMAFLLLIAGHETTVGLIGTMALGLWRHRDQRQLLLDKPSLIAHAVEEFLRFEGPVQRSTFRVATEDIEIADTLIPAGSTVSMMIGSANHDPARFANPDQLDITRDVERHVAFGQGIHFCLGAPLARAEAQIAIGSLLRRYPNYSVTVREDDLSYQPTVIRALAKLPVDLAPVATLSKGMKQMLLTGTWNLTIATPMGEQKLELELVQGGPDQISGVSRTSDDEQPLADAVLNGNHLTWTATMTKPLKITAKMDLVFDEDTVSGTAKAGMFPATKVSGHRAS